MSSAPDPALPGTAPRTRAGPCPSAPGPHTTHHHGEARTHMHTRITKAVIPAAGLGTRFLPATKATPKEMLPVVDKPAIQYVVEEA
ncbi:sugar phosphate nucleotidyltransferase, partial [Streptomyces sp. NPDC006552]|uniref:sugar phosphate nucleotidyltransferase n=1 Tax=Streptomyces sp. NPDC006552 TaxID=3157179 RepID=UPI0033B1E6DB